jgi:hypothetical protein
MITILNKKSDEVGMLSSTLCIIHCLATPFLFAAIPAATGSHHGSPEWWGLLDILFLVISFIAVYISFKHSKVGWMRTSLILSFILLTFFILNERFEGIEFPFDMVYIPAVTLVILHLVNRRQCRCAAGYCETAEEIN